MQGNEDFIDRYLCPTCNTTVEDDQSILLSLGCDGPCQKWFHRDCAGLSQSEFQRLQGNDDEMWFCINCASHIAQRNNSDVTMNNMVSPPSSPDQIDAPDVPNYPPFEPKEVNERVRSRMKWGVLSGYNNIEEKLNSAYNEVVKWNKNFFKIPLGSCGKKLVEEACKLVSLYNGKGEWEHLAIKALIVLLPLVLQKPSKNSKTRDHKAHLQRRMVMWKDGAIDGLVKEGTAIQKRFKAGTRQTSQNLTRSFSNLVLQGKISAACKLINRNNGGPLEITENVLNILKEKHPASKQATNAALVPDPTPRFVEPIIFEGIDSNLVHKAALNINGSGGPTKIDAEIWRQMLCSRSFHPASQNLCEEIAVFSRRLCREYIDPKPLQEYTACRLIPLDKEPGSPELKVRPIGIGEAIRRIVGKTVMLYLKPDMVQAAGPLQTCSGSPGGIEAAIHAMSESFQDENTEAMILVDAENAFNSLNRHASLINTGVICPEFSKYLVNTYRQSSRLYVNGMDGDFILSEEGSTQGDNAAMNMYACSIRPLIDTLGDPALYSSNGVTKAKQAWYADDSSATGSLNSITLWWNELCRIGPGLGYYPKPEKCHIVVKDLNTFNRATELFSRTDIKITMQGRPYLGSAVGTPDYIKSYVDSKVVDWVKDINTLAEIAVTEPHTAYFAYINSLSKRWTYLIRTLPGISEYLKPLEKSINENLIPAIIGKTLSPLERAIFTLPVKYGGMGMINPSEVADFEYKASKDITKPLQQAITEQSTNFNSVNMEQIKNSRKLISSAKKSIHENKLSDILSNPQSSTTLSRALELAREKGSSIWLTANPHKEHGFFLNKQEFRDSVCLRYGWKINGVPDTCACGLENDVDHALTCKRGGYVIMRHNALRNAEAALLKEVCHDVRLEPELIPIQGEELHSSTALQDRARLDISARGVWSHMERVFYDVRVTHPNTRSNCDKSLRQIYKEQQQEKKRKYNQRIIHVEKATFTPLIFTTSGGMGPECQRFNKRLAELIAIKRNESYADVITYIRKKLRFALLKATLIALRGYRGRPDQRENIELSEIDFNLIS